MYWNWSRRSPVRNGGAFFFWSSQTCCPFNLKSLLGCHPIFLVLATHDDFERILREWPLQSLRLIPWRAHPDIVLLGGRQYHWHRLRMDRRDNRVRRRCQEPI